MRVLFCWSHISGYMAACWRALAGRPDVDISVLAYRSGDAQADFKDDLVAGLPARLLSDLEQRDVNLVRSLVLDARPDVLVIPGWSSPAYQAAAFEPALGDVKRVM